MIDHVAQAVLYRLVRRIEAPRASRRYPKFGQSRSIEQGRFAIIEAQATWSTSGHVVRFSDATIEAIQDAGVDVIVRTGTGILKGAILHAAPFGVLSPHHADNRTNRGGPAGFWEVLENRPTSGFVIQQLTEELDGGKVIFRGAVTTAETWLSNYANLLEKAAPFLRKALENLAKTRVVATEREAVLYDGPLYRISSAWTLLAYLARVYPGIIVRHLGSLLKGKAEDVWSVAYMEDPTLGGSLFRYKEIINPPGRYFADPFVISHQERTICFVEDCDRATQKGSISALAVGDDGWQELGVVLEEDFHLSFPFVFEHAGEVYMLPEAAQSGQIRLYRCTDFPMKWELHSILMEGVAAADTCLVQHAGKWFMLTNICTAGLSDRNSELHVFYASAFDSPVWNPIGSGNPVVFDPLGARNAGLFQHNGQIIRVGQNQGRGIYGEGFSLHLVEQLSSEGYRERCLQTVRPRFAPGIVGTHHFHTNGRFAVVDFKRLLRRTRGRHRV